MVSPRSTCTSELSCATYLHLYDVDIIEITYTITSSMTSIINSVSHLGKSLYVCMYVSRLGMQLFCVLRANVGIACVDETLRNVAYTCARPSLHIRIPSNIDNYFQLLYIMYVANT